MARDFIVFFQSESEHLTTRCCPATLFSSSAIISTARSDILRLFSHTFIHLINYKIAGHSTELLTLFDRALSFLSVSLSQNLLQFLFLPVPLPTVSSQYLSSISPGTALTYAPSSHISNIVLILAAHLKSVAAGNAGGSSGTFRPRGHINMRRDRNQEARHDT